MTRLNPASVPVFNTVEKQDEEIDLLGLCRAVMATWKIWLISMVLVVLFFGAYQATKAVLLSDNVTYSKPIQLTFPNAHTLVFPNGSPFGYGDIIAPSVVQQAYLQNNIDQYDMSVADLQGGLSAEPYSPTYPFVVEKYQKMLADKKLTIEQLDDLRRRMQDELAQVSRGSVLISLHLKKSQLPEQVASKVLSDIPAIWAERAIRDKGVLNLNVKLASSRSLNPDLIQKVEYLIISDLLDQKLELLRQNIQKLSVFEGISTVADPETGMRLPDLVNAIDDMNRYVIDELMSPIRYLGLSRDPQLSIYYYEDRLKKLRLELSLLKNQAGLAKAAFDTYRRSAPSASSDLQDSSLTLSQLGGDTLDKLMQLSGEAEREVYMQSLNRQWLDYNLRAADVESRMSDVELIVNSLRESADKRVSNSSGIETDQLYLDRVNEAMPGILQQMGEYFDVTERIYAQLSMEAVGVNDRLYSPTTNSVLVKGADLQIKKNILVLIAQLFLTTIIVIPLMMIRNALKNNEKTKAGH